MKYLIMLLLLVVSQYAFSSGSEGTGGIPSGSEGTGGIPSSNEGEGTSQTDRTSFMLICFETKTDQFCEIVPVVELKSVDGDGSGVE